MTEQTLAALRPGLLAYCRKLRPDLADAEDLVQDTLLIALRQAQAGRQVVDWPRWLAGIARMRSRRTQPAFMPLDDEVATQVDDPLDSLLLRERGSLLELTFRNLDTATRHLLSHRYLEELPVSELAEKMGIAENTASQRLVRARKTFEEVLTRHCHEAAAAHGLLSSLTADGWTPTPIRCPRCANGLQGRLTSDSLRLLCPTCDIAGQRNGLIGLSTNAHTLEGAMVLAEARGFRIALKRVNSWWNNYIKQGLRTGKACCQWCGQLVSVQTRTMQGAVGFYTACSCGAPFYIHPAGLLLHDEAGQTFWREEEKIQFTTARSIVCGGRDAVLVGYTSRRSAATLEAVYAADSLERLELRKNK